MSETARLFEDIVNKSLETPFFYTNLNKLLKGCKDIQPQNMVKMENFMNVWRFRHSGLILDSFDKEKIDQFAYQNEDRFSLLNQTREITVTSGKEYKKITVIEMHVPFNAFVTYDKLYEFDPIIFEGQKDKTIYVSKYQKHQKQDKAINNDLSGIEYLEGNDSIASLNNQNISLFKQRVMTSTEENSYQTGYKPKRERLTYMTTRTDEEKSLIKRTEDSRGRQGDQDKTFTKFFLQEDDDPLNRPSLDDPRFAEIIKNRSRAYVTTAPIFQKKRFMVERRERIEEIKDFKEMNKSMFTLFNENNKTQLSLKVRKANEIKSIMKREQTQEKQRNLRMLNYLNNREKVRNREIRSQHQQERKNKNIVMKIMVNRTHHNNMMKKEDARFVNNFNQAKNIIEKQMFKGKLIKEKRNIRLENIQKKHVTKQSRSFMSHQAIQNKVFDSYISNPNIKLTYDNESNNNNSTTLNQENINRDCCSIIIP